MYSNERGSRFSILDIIVKLIFAALFIFILMWLFKKNVPNMTPFYSNVFRENIKYMQEAGESYFTDDKLPKEIGQSNKISLADMFDKKLVLPFVDEDGNSCNQYDSYVSVTKTDNGYELKTNLVCNKESNYTVKILGCHNYCKDSLCSKTCSVEQITEYKYKKTTNVTAYKCPSGYKKNGKYCVKSKLVDSKSASVTNTTTKDLVVAAKEVISGGKKTEVDVIKVKNSDSYEKVYINAIKETTNGTTTKTKVYVEPIKSTTSGSTKTEQEAYACQKTKTVQEPYTCQKTQTVKKTYSCQKTKTVRESYDCTKYKTEKQCSTKYKKEAYSCNCSTKYVGGVYKTACNTCYKSVPYQSCKDVNKAYTDTCYRNVNKTYTTTCTKNVNKTYNTTCYRNVTKTYTDTCYRDKTTTTPGSTTYSCPSNATGSEGSGANLRCYYYKTTTTAGKTTYKCPSNADGSTGSGENLKCYYLQKTSNGYSYKCPTKANYSTGSGENLRCYVVTNGTSHYECSDSSYKLNGKYCKKTVTESSTSKKCDSGYKLEGNKCNKYTTTKVNATKTTAKKTIYKWSKQDGISGWTKTGDTRIVKGEEKCE